MTRNTAALILALLVPGCCWTAKRSCFPPCPPTPPARVVTVERPCQLPPPLKLPKVATRPCEGASTACFDTVNAGLLATREASMKDWIRAARARCSPTSQPARSQPTTAPASP